MRSQSSSFRTSFAIVSGLLLLIARGASAQKKISCPDGDHFEIDLKQISIQYDASSFAGTLSSLSVLGSHFACWGKGDIARGR